MIWVRKYSWWRRCSVLRHIRDSSLVQTLSHVRLFATPWTSACQASLSITNSLTLLKTHVYWISDAIQPPHPLLSPSLPAFNLSQHQSFPMSQFFPSDGQSIGVSASAFVLPMNIQDWFPLGCWLDPKLVGSSCNPRDSRESSPVQKHQFFSTQLSLYSNFHIHTWLLEKP